MSTCELYSYLGLQQIKANLEHFFLEDVVVYVVNSLESDQTFEKDALYSRNSTSFSSETTERIFSTEATTDTFPTVAGPSLTKYFGLKSYQLRQGSVSSKNTGHVFFKKQYSNLNVFITTC